MGIIEIQFEDNRHQLVRQMVSDAQLFDAIFVAIEADAAFPCLGFVDPYGDTLYNRVQLAQLIKEIEKLRSDTSLTFAAVVLEELEEMAEWAVNHPHHYLGIRGD